MQSHWLIRSNEQMKKCCGAWRSLIFCFFWIKKRELQIAALGEMERKLICSLNDEVGAYGAMRAPRMIDYYHVVKEHMTIKRSIFRFNFLEERSFGGFFRGVINYPESFADLQIAEVGRSCLSFGENRFFGNSSHFSKEIDYRTRGIVH